MSRLFHWADGFIQTCTWRDMAAVKLCLFALGALAGMAVPQSGRRICRPVAAALFVVTDALLLAKMLGHFFRSAGREKET